MDKKLFRYLILFFVVSYCLSTISGVVGKWEGIAYSTYTWNELLANIVIRYVSKFVYILGSIIIIRSLVLRGIIAGWLGVLSHFILAVGLTFYSVFIQILASNLLLGSNDKITWEYVYKGAILGTDYNFFLYFSTIAIVFAYYFFQKKKDSELKESILKTQLLDSKIHALQSQLQPHFLFNALNDISSLIDESSEKSQEAISDLSDLLRQSLELSDTKFIFVRDEIDLLEKYLKIEKIRFQNKLDFNIITKEELLYRSIPPLILQPIVENSIKHGFSIRHDAINISVKIEEDGNYTSFRISNNGEPLNTDPIVYGTGIRNVILRLETLYEDNYTFEMENSEGNVSTLIKIPNTI